MNREKGKRCLVPPVFLHIRVVEPGRRKLNLWLPMVLLWPFCLLMFLFFLEMLIVLAVIRPRTMTLRQAFSAGPLIYGLICSFNGTKVEVSRFDREFLFTLS